MSHSATLITMEPIKLVPRSKKWRRRKRKFDEMATDLSALLAGKGNTILCPLCLSEFHESDSGPSRVDPLAPTPDRHS
jgi:hypothetical protein